jgi:hypothetical protein
MVPRARWGSTWFGGSQCEKLKQGVCHTVAMPFTFKKYLKAKEELWKPKYFTMQKCNLQKIVKKKPKSFKVL